MSSVVDERPKRRYSSNACLACRRAKVRCDNKQPRCSNCAYRNVECVLGEDRRRIASALNKPPEGNKSATASLGMPAGSTPLLGIQENLIDLWTDLAQTPAARASIAGNTASPPREKDFNQLYPSDNAGLDINSDLDSAGLDFWLKMPGQDGFVDVGSDIDASPFGAIVGDHYFGIDTAPGLSPLVDGPSDTLHLHRTISRTDIDSDTSPTAHQGLPQKAADQRLRRRPSAATTSPQSHTDEPTEQLASRLGRLRIAEDGQLRYYGATSNLHMIRNGMLPCFQPTIRTTSTHGKAALERAGLPWNDDPEYEAHLTKLFFAWHNTFLYVVHEAAYYSHRSLHRSGASTTYYSPTLENAIFAIGAAYATSKHPAIKEDPAEFFAYRAKVLLDIEMDSPTIATIQALVTLSAHEAAFARDSRGEHETPSNLLYNMVDRSNTPLSEGWLYAGMAVQLLSDLGLHLDLDVAHDADDEPVDINDGTNLRRTVFWATQALDSLWSAFCGRPSSVRYDDQNIPIPSPLTTSTWRPYVDSQSSLQLPPGLDAAAVGSTHVCVAQLSIKIRKISRYLYTGPQGSLADAKFFVKNMTRELQHWRNCLPAALQIDPLQEEKSTPHLPAVIMLHMQFHEAMIFLHRPFISAPGVPAAVPLHDSNGAQIDANDDDSGTICEQSANAICRLVVMYRHQWNLRRIHAQVVAIILTAALIHVHNCCVFSSEKGVRAQEQLSICFQALAEMSHFNMSTRALEIILSLRRDWQTRTFSHTGRKRLGGDTQRSW